MKRPAVGLWLVVLGLIGLGGFIPTRSEGCPACVGPGRPKLTLVQQLLDSDQAVEAVATAQPGVFQVVSGIKGDLAAGQSIELDIDQRPALSLAQGQRVVLGRYGLAKRWTLFGQITAGRSDWLRKISGLKRTSELAEADWKDRIALFLPYLNDDDSLVRGTAVGEIARAPYASMRSVKGRLERDQLLAILSRASETERPLFYLLLGVVGAEEDEGVIDDLLTIRQRQHGADNLAALLVAKLEIRGPGWTKELSQRYLANREATDAEKNAACMALSIHGESQPQRFRDSVVELYDQLCMEGVLVPAMLEDLTAWKRWEFRPRMVDLLSRETTPRGTKEAIHKYITACEAAERIPLGVAIQESSRE